VLNTHSLPKVVQASASTTAHPPPLTPCRGTACRNVRKHQQHARDQPRAQRNLEPANDTVPSHGGVFACTLAPDRHVAWALSEPIAARHRRLQLTPHSRL